MARSKGPAVQWDIAWPIVIHALLVLFLAWKLNIWVDESFTLETTGEGLSHAWIQATRFEVQPPLYYFCLTLWRSASESVFMARLFSVLCSILALVACLPLLRRWLPDTRPTWFLVCWALNPFTLYAATEIRVYAFAILLVVLLYITFYDGFLVDRPRARDQILYTSIALLALYTQYYLGFLLAGNAAALLALRRFSALKNYLLGMVAVAVCFAPMGFVIYQQIVDNSAILIDTASFRERLTHIPRRFQEYSWPIHADWSRVVRWPLFFGMYAFLGALFVRGRRNVDSSLWALLAILTVAGAIYAVVAVGVTGLNFMAYRHTVGLFVPTLLCAFRLVALRSGGSANTRLAAWCVPALVLSSIVGIQTFGILAKSGDWSRVADYIEAREGANEPILVFTPYAAIPLARYYDGRGQIVPIPRVEDFTFFDPSGHALADVEDLAKAVEAGGTVPESLWVVTNCDPRLPCDATGIDYKIELLEEYLAMNYRVTESVSFYRAWVRHFTLRSP